MLTTYVSCSSISSLLRTSFCWRSFSLIKRTSGSRARKLFAVVSEDRRIVAEAYLRGRINALSILNCYRRPSNVRWLLSLSVILLGCGFVKLFSSILALLSFPRPPPSLFNILSKRDWRAPKGSKLTFDDVVGCSEAKEELQAVIRFLSTPETFSAVGAHPPSGILLVGPPGVGKTLLGRALAGESGVRYLLAEGVELGGDLSGEGARLVRDLFSAARQRRGPTLVFIDGVEAACPRRDGGETQTTNQLLVEMDGLKSRQADRTVLVLGTTSREDLLDPAALRGGRFGLTIRVRPPDLAERIEMFRLYAGRIILGRVSDNIWETLGRLSAGLTGADIANAVNRAAIQAAVGGREEVGPDDLLQALQGRLDASEDSTESRRTRAVHEAGHAVLTRFTRHAPALSGVSISGRQNASHVRLWKLEDSTEHGATRAQLRAMLDVLLAGRIAEEEFLGSDKVSIASRDLEEATMLAEEMVKRHGMSECVGTRFVDGHVSEALEDLVDQEVSRLLRESCARVRTVLQTRWRETKRVVAALQRYEKLDNEDLSAVLIGGVPKAGVEKESEAERLITRWSNF